MLEGLERRDLMAYSALGYSLPDVVASGTTGQVVAWGGPLSVSVDVRNIGASSMIEPLNLTPGATSTADAPATTVAVIAKPHWNPRAQGIIIGSLDVPAVTQNNMVRVNGSFTMPARPSGYPGSGGKLDIFFVVNPDKTFLENDPTNNIGRAASPVLVEAALPDLETTVLDVPPTLNPGDVVQPNIRIANLGTMPTNLQAPVKVQLVASLDRNFGPGDAVVATYTIDNINPISVAPSGRLVLGDTNLTPGDNIATIQGQPVALPAAPGKYYLGVIIDPDNQIKELHEVGRGANFRLQQVRNVGPNVSGLPPAGVISTFNPGVVPLFPYPGVTSTGAGTVITLSTTAAGSVSASNTTSSTPGVTYGAAQARVIKSLKNKPINTATLVGLSQITSPAVTAPFVTSQLSSSEQDGSFLYPQIIQVPATTLFQPGALNRVKKSVPIV